METLPEPLPINESMDGYEWGPEPPELLMPGSEEECEINGEEF